MPRQRQVEINRNVDLPVTVWAHNSGLNVEIQKRPNPSTLGREIPVALNTFNVTSLPSAPVYQYDVLLGNGEEKRPVVRKLLASKALRNSLPKPQRWIFDGNKIAYSTEKLPQELRVMVDLDAEEGRTPKPGKNNSFRVIVKATVNAVIRFDQLKAYLEGRADFGTGCLEAINFLDHLIREYPSQRLTPIKRNFYRSGGERKPLGSGAEALKGTYASVRVAHSQNGPHTLSVNVDVANGTFWTAGSLLKLVMAVLPASRDQEIAARARAEPGARNLKKLRRLHVEAKHRGNGQVDTYCIDKFVDQNAAQAKIPSENGKPAISIADYFQRQYNIRVRIDLPLVKMTKGKNTLVPMELLTVKENQRVNGKLDERQTTAMLGFAVTVPPIRWAETQKALDALDWKNDPYLSGYGLKISDQRVQAKGRLIPNPKVTFTGSDLDPKTTGRWRIDGRKFLQPNKVPLKSWGVCIIGSRNVDRATVQKFMADFVKIYISHGGKVESRNPYIHVPTNPNPATAVEETYIATGNTFKAEPQILVFILPSKDATTYGRIKKSCECRFGLASQCMQGSNVAKGQAQYISNVLMKFNAKLGGITARACGPTSKGPQGIFTKLTMIVAADVTHPPPAGQVTDEAGFSIAAIVNSQDRLATRYTARVQTNGYRVEMIQQKNWEQIWLPQLRNWVSNPQGGAGRLPEIIIYFRDGVSEGQFASVIRQELADMKDVVRKVDPKAGVKFIVIIATKRHHVRFFPQNGDKNGNALPGTLVETAVTHPYENDFFLCSHVALKGTARPVHYHVLVNEPNAPNDWIQTLIAEHSYQFMRATTPVSLFPAVYYADICALRGKYHDRAFGTPQAAAPRGRDDDKKHPGSRTPSQSKTSSSDSAPSDIPDLMTMAKGMAETMWYI
ncbi:Piwi-domain-containing protein [Myriangium duriaei CBS 260.36]|uniref:Piwi-domain-containing protein n=1 Tax=Myriangium duriaei CBS 260.36 TaxID=1168546 RepID=A0A9P4J783_9PEZI|nr:Piwi-domain-containing protein [Myriangium duriaei CBS 260.36]